MGGGSFLIVSWEMGFGKVRWRLVSAGVGRSIEFGAVVANGEWLVRWIFAFKASMTLLCDILSSSVFVVVVEYEMEARVLFLFSMLIEGGPPGEMGVVGC
jgi:hypothetical protein